jgi:hypothetical protein
MNNNNEIIDHSAIDIEAEIQKFLNNGGEIKQIIRTDNFKKYRKNSINISHSEEQNSTE